MEKHELAHNSQDYVLSPEQARTLVEKLISSVHQAETLYAEVPPVQKEQH